MSALAQHRVVTTERRLKTKYLDSSSTCQTHTVHYYNILGAFFFIIRLLMKNEIKKWINDLIKNKNRFHEESLESLVDRITRLAETEYSECNAIIIRFGSEVCLGKWSTAHDDLPTGQSLGMNIHEQTNCSVSDLMSTVNGPSLFLHPSSQLWPFTEWPDKLMMAFRNCQSG